MRNFRGMAIMYLAVIFSIFSVTFTQPVADSKKSYLMHPIGIAENTDNYENNFLSSDAGTLIKVLDPNENDNENNNNYNDNHDEIQNNKIGKQELESFLISDNINSNLISSIDNSENNSEDNSEKNIDEFLKELFSVSSKDMEDYNYYHDNYSFDTVDTDSSIRSELNTAPFFVNPVFYSKKPESIDGNQDQLDFGTGNERGDDDRNSKENYHFLMYADSQISKNEEKKKDPCDHVCSNRINFNDKMFLKPLCSTTGIFYDSQSSPSLGCDRCRNRNIEIDRNSKYTVCENARVCVEGQSSWRCPWW